MNHNTRFLIASHLLMGLALFFWFTPFFHPFCVELDTTIFRALNNSLAQNTYWQYFWGLLNHRLESTYNILVAALFNIWVVVKTKNAGLKQKRLLQFAYFWVFFQIGFAMQELFFHQYLHIERQSPSLVLKKVIRLSSVLNNPSIKDGSSRSFPGGHAFAFTYWAFFSYLASPRGMGFLGIFFALLLCLPRLFSGAHWASDVIFSILLAFCWLSWTLIVPLYNWICAKT